MLVTKTKTFSGRLERVVHVATFNDVNLMLYGVLLSGEPDWLRICTTEIKQAEKIAFLSPDAHVEIRVRDDVQRIALPQLTSFARIENIPGDRSETLQPFSKPFTG